jgi:hypothetical protein
MGLRVVRRQLQNVKRECEDRQESSKGRLHFATLPSMFANSNHRQDASRYLSPLDFLTIAAIPLDRQPRTQYVDSLAAFRRTREKQAGPASSQRSIGLQLQCW